MKDQQRTIYHTELSVREPTGLVLGVFDEITIQRKIYQREFGPSCEFRRADDPEAPWEQLVEYASFADAFWVAGINLAGADTKRVARFAWGRSGTSASASVGPRAMSRQAGPLPAGPESEAEDPTAVFTPD